MKTFKKILVPLDGSELAERVVLPAIRLAEAIRADIVLLTVVSPLPRPDHADTVEGVVQTRRYEAGLYLKGVRNHFLPSSAAVETAVLSGPAAQTIITYAKEQAVDLIIMTTHGRSGLTRWTLGRVAEKVLRRAPCPTVILRSEQALAPEHIRRVLLPLDGSPLAEAVLEPTLTVARDLQAEVLLLRVIEPVVPFARGWEETAVSPSELQTAQAYLEKVQQNVRAWDVKSSCQVTAGPAAEAIIDFADTNQIDLIVLSSLGSSGFQFWLFGSVAERVMKNAHCATMVVRHEEAGQTAVN